MAVLAPPALLLVVLAAGCGSPPPERLESEPGAIGPVRVETIEGQGIEATVSVPQDPTVPTYEVEIRRGGRKQRLTPSRRGNLDRIWLDDVEQDGVPDLLVQTIGPGLNAYGYLDVIELRPDGPRLRALPPLADDQLAGYRGHDTFAVRQGRLYRSYPVYAPDDPDDRPSGGVRQFVLDPKQVRWLLAGA